MTNYSDTCFGYDANFPMIYGFPTCDEPDTLPTLDNPRYSGKMGSTLKAEYDYDADLFRVDDNHNYGIAYIEESDFSDLFRFAKENRYDRVEIEV